MPRSSSPSTSRAPPGPLPRKAHRPSIANSPLVKTAIAGEDANWGRIVMAVGKAGEKADRDKLAISIGGVEITRNGQRRRLTTRRRWPPISRPATSISASMSASARLKARVWTCDLTHRYIEINADYRSRDRDRPPAVAPTPATRTRRRSCASVERFRRGALYLHHPAIPMTCRWRWISSPPSKWRHMPPPDSSTTRRAPSSLGSSEGRTMPLVGCVGLQKTPEGPELGYWVGREHWRHGVAPRPPAAWCASPSRISPCRNWWPPPSPSTMPRTSAGKIGFTICGTGEIHSRAQELPSAGHPSPPEAQRLAAQDRPRRHDGAA